MTACSLGLGCMLRTHGEPLGGPEGGEQQEGERQGGSAGGKHRRGSREGENTKGEAGRGTSYEGVALEADRRRQVRKDAGGTQLKGQADQGTCVRPG